ncbi:50S ribosomal protein L4, partial [Patescibacteria group bacterium]|nr:50S ribosomal protein L4 [Patescibacteria group bacterium]
MEIIKIYNSKGEEKGEMELPKFLQLEWNPLLVKQVVDSILANSRQVVAHTKGRGEVSGGGKKPWKQKGTGRARHGSIRSPLWKGGGVTFGPKKERDFSKKINKKMLKKALLIVLAKKAQDGEIKIIESFDLVVPKTKAVSEMIKKITSGKSTLVLLEKNDKNTNLSVRNLKNVKNMIAENLSAYDLLSF